MNRRELSISLFVGMVAILSTSGAIQAASHDVAWTFGNVGSSSYRLDAFEPGDAGLGASIGTQNPTLTVQVGRRYQVTVTNFIPHPLQVLAKAILPGQTLPFCLRAAVSVLSNLIPKSIGWIMVQVQ